tara:strand:- start:461 stop:925 length:465 start_codon:yes stop_codon:yes gene_type:complete
MEFAELKKDIIEFNGIVSSDIKCVRNHKGDVRKLNEFNWKMKSRNYRMEMRREELGRKVQKSIQLDSLDVVATTLYKLEYSKEWTALPKTSKLKQLKKFLEAYQKDATLGRKEMNSIKRAVYVEFEHKNLVVEYDKNKCSIVKLPLLSTFDSTT